MTLISKHSTVPSKNRGIHVVSVIETQGSLNGRHNVSRIVF